MLNIQSKIAKKLLPLVLINLPLLSCGNLLNDEVLNKSSDNDTVKYFETYFDKKISSESNLILQTKYSEYVVTGTIINDNNIENVWLSSLGDDGKPLFESVIKSDKNTRVAAQITDPDSNYIVVCNEYDENNNSSIIIINISQNRTITWYKRLGSSTTTIAKSAVLNSDGILAVIAQEENPDTLQLEPVLILFNTVTKSVSSFRLQFILPVYNTQVYPVPVKIVSGSDDSLIITGFFVDKYNGLNRVTVVKLDASFSITSRYILSESTKNLAVLDIINENKDNDIFLMCKTSAPDSRSEGFTLLKIFSNNKKIQKKFENDFAINGFHISDNIITGSGCFYIGGYTLNGTNNYSATLLRFNYSGNMNKYLILESGINSINKLVFSQFEKNSSLSYIYTCNKISDNIDGRLQVRKKNTGEEITEKAADISKDVSSSSGTLYPVNLDEDLTVETQDVQDISIKPDLGLDIEWK